MPDAASLPYSLALLDRLASARRRGLAAGRALATNNRPSLSAPRGVLPNRRPLIWQ